MLRVCLLSLLLVLPAVARAQDPDCAGAPDYSKCMHDKGVKQMGMPKPQPATTPTRTRPSTPARTRSLADSIRADSIDRARAEEARRASDAAAERDRTLRQQTADALGMALGLALREVWVEKYAEVADRLEAVLRDGTGAPLSSGFFRRDAASWTPILVQLGVAYMELAEVYGYRTPPDPDPRRNLGWVPDRYADRGLAWLALADSLGSPDAAYALQEYLNPTTHLWATDPTYARQPGEWRPGLIPVRPDWLTADGERQPSPTSPVAAGTRRWLQERASLAPRLQLPLDFPARRGRIRALANARGEQWARAVAAAQAPDATSSAAVADFAASERALAAGQASRQREAAGAAEVARFKQELAQADVAARAAETAASEAARRAAGSDSAKAARRRWWWEVSGELARLGVKTITPLPEAETGPVIARVLQLARARGAALRPPFDPDRAPSPDEARRVVAAARAALGSTERWLADTALWPSHTTTIPSEVARFQQKLAGLRAALAAGCTADQPRGCAPLAAWLYANYQTDAATLTHARPLGELACRTEPATAVCAALAGDYLGHGLGQPRGLAALARACAAEPRAPDSFEPSACGGLARCLTNGTCGPPDVPLALEVLRLACAHREQAECGPAGYESFAYLLEQDLTP